MAFGLIIKGGSVKLANCNVIVRLILNWVADSGINDFLNNEISRLSLMDKIFIEFFDSKTDSTSKE